MSKESNNIEELKSILGSMFSEMVVLDYYNSKRTLQILNATASLIKNIILFQLKTITNATTDNLCQKVPTNIPILRDHNMPLDQVQYEAIKIIVNALMIAAQSLNNKEIILKMESNKAYLEKIGKDISSWNLVTVVKSVVDLFPHP